MPQRDSRPVQVLAGGEFFVFGTSISTLAEMLNFHSFNIAIVNSSWNPFPTSWEKIEWQGIGEDLVHLQIYSLRVLQIQCQAQRHGMGWSSHQASKTKGHWACEMRWIYTFIHLSFINVCFLFHTLKVMHGPGNSILVNLKFLFIRGCLGKQYQSELQAESIICLTGQQRCHSSATDVPWLIQCKGRQSFGVRLCPTEGIRFWIQDFMHFFEVCTMGSGQTPLGMCFFSHCTLRQLYLHGRTVPW